MFRDCLQQARDYLRAGQASHDAGLKHVAFGLAVLGFEELGKAAMIVMASAVGKTDPDRARRLLRQTEEHEWKIFWATWGRWGSRPPANDAESIGSFLDVAARLHEMRMDAMYVHVARDESPRSSVPDELVRSTMAMLEAQIQLAEAAGVAEPSLKEQEIFDWLMKAAEEPDKRPLIFGASSLKKRSELRDPLAWARWLKEQFDEADQRSRELTERELRRRPEDSKEPWKARWKVTLRWQSSSHSIRPRAFDKWNKGSEHVKFRADSNDKTRFFVDIDIPELVGAGGVWDAGLQYSAALLIAFNAGSFGFFWWRVPPKTTRYYERILDLDVKSELVVEAYPAPIVDWGNNAFTSDEMDSVTRAFVGLRKFEGPSFDAVVTNYLEGMKIAAKIDIHLRVESSALAAFARSFAATLPLVEPPQADLMQAVESLVDRYRLAKDDPSYKEKLKEWVARAQDKTFADSNVTLRDVMAVKIIADVNINTLAQQGLNALYKSEGDPDGSVG